MVHPLTTIRIADVRNDIVKSYTMSEFFQKYSHKTVMFDDMSRIIRFDSSDGIKITDWTGWTEVLSIRRIDNPDAIWRSITISQQDHDYIMDLRVSKSEYIPIYERNSMRGFHGEIKYLYEILSIENTNNNSLMRAIVKSDLIDPDGMYEININSDEIYDKDYTYGYEIVTKSGFYNGNQFHLYGTYLVHPVGKCYK